MRQRIPDGHQPIARGPLPVHLKEDTEGGILDGFARFVGDLDLGGGVGIQHTPGKLFGHESPPYAPTVTSLADLDRQE